MGLLCDTLLFVMPLFLECTSGSSLGKVRISMNMKGLSGHPSLIPVEVAYVSDSLPPSATYDKGALHMDMMALTIFSGMTVMQGLMVDFVKVLLPVDAGDVKR